MRVDYIVLLVVAFVGFGLGLWTLAAAREYRQRRDASVAMDAHRFKCNTCGGDVRCVAGLLKDAANKMGLCSVPLSIAR